MKPSSDYQAQLKHMHESRPAEKKWGTTGARNAGKQIADFINGRGNISTVLDFGAGQGSLGNYLRSNCPGIQVAEYDPGIAGLDKLEDRQYDLIVSSDVLEHVEPECIDGTIRWMQDHATKAMFHHIACDPCGLILPDGRNAHLIVQPPAWWREKFLHPAWSLMYYADIEQRKRGSLRRAVQLQLDKVG